MGFPEDDLNDGEEIIIHRHPHWTYMGSAVVMIVFSFAAAIALAVLFPIAAWLGGICVVVAFIGSFGQYLRWRTTHFIITTNRIMVSRGIFARSGVDIPLERVTNISFRQTIIERILGTGDLAVESAGESGRQILGDIADPNGVQNLIYKYADLALDDRHGDSVGHTSSEHSDHLSVPEQLEKLAELRDRGILSGQEFEAQKHKLLNQ